MSYAQYLRQLLRPLGVYDVEGRYLSGELEAEGLALDGVESVLDELQREANLATAEDWGLERIAGLLRRRPPASTTKAMREALAALLRISGDSFTLEAINDTIAGCGVIARVDETDEPGTVEVWFPEIPGIPPAFEEIDKIISDISPAHLLIRYRFWFITWEQLEQRLPTWQDIEEKHLTWEQLQSYVEPGTQT